MILFLSPHRYAFFVECLLEHGNGYLAVVEDAGGQCGIGTSVGEHIGNVVNAAGPALGNDGYMQMFGQAGKGVARVSLSSAVVVH